MHIPIRCADKEKNKIKLLNKVICACLVILYNIYNI